MYTSQSTRFSDGQGPGEHALWRRLRGRGWRRGSFGVTLKQPACTYGDVKEKMEPASKGQLLQTEMGFSEQLLEKSKSL